MSTLGERIKNKRKELGLTQAELGDKLGVTDRAVSKWEQDEGNPDMSIVGALAATLGVSLDYLLLGKETTNFSLDDLDPAKRALYLAENDDAANFSKYGYVRSEVFFCKEVLRNMRPQKDYLALRAKILENRSEKVFSLLADKLLQDLKQRQWDYLWSQFSGSAAGLFYDCLDDFVKLCAITGKIELLQFLRFKSFGIGKNTQQFHRGTNLDDFYSIEQETLDFIFTDKRVPETVVEYVAKYEKYGGREFRYPCGPADHFDSCGAFRMGDRILLSLYKAKKADLIEAYLADMLDEARKSAERVPTGRDVDGCWRSSYKFGPYGYMFYTNGNGSGETTTVQGRITSVSAAITYAVSQKDKKAALRFSRHNEAIKEILDGIKIYKEKPGVHVITEEIVDHEIAQINKQELYESIVNDRTISDYDRRRKLFAIGALKLEDVIVNDDYDLFVQFPFEIISPVTITAVANSCSDIRFFIFAVNAGQTQERLDSALGIILQKTPDRYDVLDVLLSAGAQVKDNPAMTAILKQNILILNGQKAAKAPDVEIDAKATKEKLLDALKDGRCEYVIVNLTIQLEQKLKAKYGSAQLLDMIDSACNDGLVTDRERAMLHSLRKSRNTIMHQGDERGFYTPEIVERWIEIVYKI